MKHPFKKAMLIVVAVAIVCLSATALMACNDTRAQSGEIFIDDFSGTYRISVKADVKNHSILPEASRVFEYTKGFDKLYEAIKNEPRNGSMIRKENGVIVVDLLANGRTYSCLIYPTGEKNKYIVHSMAYALGEWAEYRQIFFPAFTLDKEISRLDAENTTYGCSYKIDALAAYYKERGYYAEINENVLHVVCLLRYPSCFDDSYDRAISWSVIYDEENTIRFADVANKYE